MRRSAFVASLAAALAGPALAAPARARVRAAEGLRLETVRGGGVLRIGMTGDYKPYTYLAGDGTWSGLDVDVARALAAALGVQAAFVRTSWPALTGDLVAGEFDVAMGGVSRDPKRAAAGLLSPPYVVDGKVALIRAADRERYRTLADLDVITTRVALNPGGTNESFDRENLHHALLTVVEKNLSIPPLVAEGAYDAMVTDGVEAALAVRGDPRLAVMNADKPFTRLEKVYFCPKDAAGLVAFIGERMRAWEADGTYARWRTAWIGSNLNAP
ncbi:MAG: cyclohexadienyl dehydratase [Candidatus Eremiobacteraeota bacterium]|jgi:cyclohexadienyl dehydratase|nr:cyclohexadienyl dehydratase [Candidatus Eremiobacteraeota bacterium]